MDTSPSVPLVVIYNYLELFAGFLNRLGDPELIRTRRFADRDLFWLGDPKLVITETSMQANETLLKRWGYPGTRWLTPEPRTQQLCLNILSDRAILAELAAYAGPGRALRIVPYATTPELFCLAQALREVYGLTIHLPESCAPENLWVRNLIDSKIGFRLLAQQWLDDPGLLPEGFISWNLNEAVQIAGMFLRQGRSCVVKYDQGGGGVGNCFLFAGEELDSGQIRARLEEHHALFDQPSVIEAYILPHHALSPSLEFFVPPLGQAAPRITYVCNQIFDTNGSFSGLLLSPELARASWYPRMAAAGLRIAEQLQALGYVGFFDLDAVLDTREQLYLLEVNARRTGGTYADEFARFQIGEDYQDRVVLFGNSSFDSHGLPDLPALLECLEGLLYPMAAQQLGLLITSISTLPEGKFGALLIAPDLPQLEALRQQLETRLTHASQPCP